MEKREREKDEGEEGKKEGNNGERLKSGSKNLSAPSASLPIQQLDETERNVKKESRKGRK